MHSTGERTDRDLLLPHPPPPGRATRVVGPGRLERGYRTRIEALEGELEAARLVERGAQRRQDKLEAAVGDARALLGEATQRERRLVLALGHVQGENAELRRRLEQIEGLAASEPRPALAERTARAPRRARPGLLARLFHRTRPA